MSKEIYKRCLGRVVANPLLLSGVHLAKRVKLFDAMQTLGKPCDISTLSKQTGLKERYVDELMKSFISSEVVQVTSQSEVLVPDWSVFKETFLSRELEYIRPFEKVSPILEKCFTESGPAGYTHDEAPYVMDYVRSLRALYNKSIAKELAELMKTHAGKYKNVLDMGCGTGDITTPLAEELTASTVLGCDISEKAIMSANMCSFTVKNVSYSVENINKLPETWSKKYDVVLMFDVLHDLTFPEAAIKQVQKVLAKDGIVIIVDPKVSSDPAKNVGNIQAAQALTISSWWCIPSTSCDHGCGLGVGWGWENKEKFLMDMGFVVKSRVCIINSDYNYAYVCKLK